MPPIPAYDLAFRFERALQPDALRIVTTCARAVNEAMDDARLAGLDPETDPAVLILARHMGRIAAGGDPEARHPEDAVLRASCTERIERLRSADVLVPLVRRGVGYDPHLIRVYKDAARSRLRALAHELGFYGDTYDLRSLAAGSAAAPRFELATDRFRLQLDPDRMMPGREVTYMRAERRQGGWTGSPTRVEIGILGDIAKFARTLCRELHLAAPAQTTALWKKGSHHGMALHAAVEHVPALDTEGVSRPPIHLRTRLWSNR